MKKLIQQILKSEQVLNLRDKSNRSYITGLIMEAIQTEGWYLNIGTHRSTTKPLSSSQRIAEFDPDGIDYDGFEDESTRLSGIEYSDFANLSFGNDKITHDGDGKPLDKPSHQRRIKSYGFFKNEYHDD